MAEPNVKSIFDMEPDAATKARLDAEAEAEYAAGRFVPHERVREWPLKLPGGEGSAESATSDADVTPW
jgi:hypothetical protein